MRWKSCMRIHKQWWNWMVEWAETKFGVRVGVHRGSVFSSLLWIILLEALSRRRVVKSGNYPCGACNNGLGSNSIQCMSCYAQHGFITDAVGLKAVWDKSTQYCCVKRMKGDPVRSECVMVYGSETWQMKQEEMQWLERIERMMVWWMCGVKLKIRISSQDLNRRLDVDGIRRL